MKRAGLPAWGLCGELTAPHLEKSACHEMLHRISDLGSFFGRTEAMHNGHTIWNLECEESVSTQNAEESYTIVG